MGCSPLPNHPYISFFRFCTGFFFHPQKEICVKGMEGGGGIGGERGFGASECGYGVGYMVAVVVVVVVVVVMVCGGKGKLGARIWL